MYSFCLRDDDGKQIICVIVHILCDPSVLTSILLLRDANAELMDLEELIEGASALLKEVRSLLPDVRMELSLLFHRDRGIAFDRLIQYLNVLEGQLENFRGMSSAVLGLYPNATHAQFIQSMKPGMRELIRECLIVSDASADNPHPTFESR